MIGVTCCVNVGILSVGGVVLGQQSLICTAALGGSWEADGSRLMQNILNVTEQNYWLGEGYGDCGGFTFRQSDGSSLTS